MKLKNPRCRFCRVFVPERWITFCPACESKLPARLRRAIASSRRAHPSRISAAVARRALQMALDRLAASR